VTGTVYLIHKIANDMRSRGAGRILITGSIAGFMPGTYQAVYNGTKAFLDSFSFALRAELKDSGVTVTCLMPGATETDFFERADMLDTKVGQQKKDDPADVAKVGFDAMMKGQRDVVSGWQNKLRSAISTATPAGVVAECTAAWRNRRIKAASPWLVDAASRGCTLKTKERCAGSAETIGFAAHPHGFFSGRSPCSIQQAPALDAGVVRPCPIGR
jgi:NAD(P)-dependent dehydrogenase (short-subunit alcohol dehydrogenase family)